MTAADIFAPLIRDVAVALLGEPDAETHNRETLRWGSRGSFKVDVPEGVWHDKEANEGGGVLALVMREKGCDKGEALSWLEAEGLIPPRERDITRGTFYDYRDESGAILFRVERRSGTGSRFLQHGPDGNGGFACRKGCMQGVRRVLYRLPELIAADPAALVFVCEGEKDTDRLASKDLIATTNPGGAGKFLREFAPMLAGRRVVVLADNDQAGRDHAADVKAKLEGIAAEVAVLRLPGGDKSDASDWLDAGGTREELVRLAEAALARGPIEPINGHRRIEAITLEDFLARELPPRDNLLAPWLPAKGLAMVFAPRGVGKTHLALSIAYAVASGGRFLRWAAPQPRPVLILDGEMPAVVLQERLAGIAAGAERESLPGYVRLLPYDLFEMGGPDLSSEEGQAELEPLIGDAALIVIDNISTICRAGKENEAESWALIQAWALGQRRKGRSVLFIHHAGKGGDQRGTSKREDVMDTVIRLSRPSDYLPQEGARFLVDFTKSRGFSGGDAEPFEAALYDGQWTTKSLEDVRTSRILELKADGLTQRQIAAELGVGLATVNRTLKLVVDND